MTTQSDLQDITISDVLRMALPLETAVLSGTTVARQKIHWTVLLTSWQELASQAQQDDLVLVPPALQDSLDSTMLSIRLQELNALDVAGVVFFKDLTQKITEAANNWSLPILIAPQTQSVRETYKSIATLLVDRQFATAERGMQLYQMLAEMSREEQGLAAMTDVICKLTGKAVIIQDKRLEVRAISTPQNLTYELDNIVDIIKQREQLPSVLRNRKAAARAQQAYWQQVLPENIGRLISPIISGDRARGYISLLGPADNLDLLDNLAVEHGASACALEFAKAKAVSEAKKSLRGNFLEGLLAGTLPQKEIERLERRLDHNTQQPHAIMVFSWGGKDQPSIRRLETSINWLIQNHRRAALIHTYAEKHVIVFQALKNAEEFDTAKELANRLKEQVLKEFPDAQLIAGLNGPVLSLNEWPTVYNEALQAMQLGEKLQLNQIVEFNSLGVYRLLGQLEELQQVKEFTEQVIGPLVTYDKHHRSSLVKTIDAYFTHHGNISQTAETLYIHRNTLLYRLERIQELTKHDMNQSNMRLALHLALKIWQLRSNHEP